MVEEIVKIDEQVEQVKRGRGRPTKAEGEKVDLKDKDVRRGYNSSFYKKHVGEKKHCSTCEKSYSWYNFSKHINTYSHLQNVEKLYQDKK